MLDSDLVQKARSGDRLAFGKLVALHQSAVFATCLRLCGNSHDAEDLAHDSFVEAFLKLKQLRDPQRFSGWLRTITLNVFRMWLRKRPPSSEDIPPNLAAQEPDPTPEWQAMAISQNLFKISFSQRITMILHYFEQLSYEEISSFLNIPIGTVMSRLHRGRQALEDMMNNQSDSHPTLPPDHISQGVLAEIDVLLELFQDQPETAERLSIILERSPERLDQLLSSKVNPTALTNIGALLGKLGARAITSTLQAAFSSQATAQSNGRKVLGSAVRHLQTVAWHGTSDPTANLHTYLLTDRIIVFPAATAQKATLLLSLLSEVTDSAVGDLLIDLLFKYEPDATVLVLEQFESMPDRTALFRQPFVLRALFRTADALCQRLVEDLSSNATEKRLAALRLLETWGRFFEAPGTETMTAPQFALEKRHNHITLRAKLSESCLSTICSLLGSFLESTDSNEAESAIRACAALSENSHLQAIRHYLWHDSQELRIAAIRAVSSLRDTDSNERLVELAQSRSEAEALASIEAIGHLKVWQAKDLLIGLADRGGDKLQAAAVCALGELGGDEIEAILRHLASEGSVERAKAVAKALFSGPRPARQATETAKKVWEKLRGKDAHPFVEVSIEATIRFALTEMRSYQERELSLKISRVCVDFSSCRRMLIEQGLMTRENAKYQFTPLGEACFRTEQFIEGRL